MRPMIYRVGHVFLLSDHMFDIAHRTPSHYIKYDFVSSISQIEVPSRTCGIYSIYKIEFNFRDGVRSMRSNIIIKWK